MTTTVKRGDSVPLTLTLGADLSGYDDANVILCSHGADPIEIPGTITAGTGGTVTCTLTADHTATVGDYRVEVEMTPGPHTFPSNGYVTLSVVADLG